MRHAVFSDVHSNLPALEAVLRDARILGVNVIHFGGDGVGYNSQPNEVTSLLQDFCADGVMGNHDFFACNPEKQFNGNSCAGVAMEFTRSRLTKRNRCFLERLPTRLSTGKMFIVHGSPKLPLDNYVEEDSDLGDELGIVDEPILVMCHTHRPYIRYVGGKLVVNPGSVGQPRDDDARASYAIIDDVAMTASIRRVPYSVRVAYEHIKREKLPDILGVRLFHGV